MFLVSHSKRQILLETRGRCSLDVLWCILIDRVFATAVWPAQWPLSCTADLCVHNIRSLCSQGPLLPGMCIMPRAGPMGSLTTASGATHLHALSALNVCTKGRHSVQRPGNFIKNSRKTIKETPSCLFKIHSCISSKIYSCEKYYGNNWLYFCLQGMFFIFNQYYSANGVLEGRWLFLKEYSCSAVCFTVSTRLYAEMWLKAGDL